MKKQTGILISIYFLLLSGCSGSIGEFFSERYQNVMGYFNTYYNAKKIFDEALIELKKNPSKDLDTNYFAQYFPNASVKTKFNIVLEKASKILQYYPKSKWFDDALMMIGEIYYYQEENDLAIRKFEELIDNFPESKYYWRAHILYARTLYNAEEYDNAISYIDKILPAVISKDQDAAIELYLLKAQILYEQNQYDKSINSLSESLKIDGDEYLLALTSYLKGRIHEVIREYDAAKNAYMSVLDYDPDKNLEFKAKLSYAKMLRELGEYKKALEYFSDMRDDNLLQANLSYIDLEIARTYEKMGDLERAIYQYELVDSLYKNTDASAKSFYYRGIMYENIFDFPEAKFYYDKARSEFPQSEITNSAQKKSEILSKIIQIKNDLLSYDSLFLKLADTTKSKDTIPSYQMDSSKEILSTASIDTSGMMLDTLIKGDNITLEEDVLEDPLENKDLNRPTPVKLFIHTNITPDSLLFLKTKAQMELATIYFLELGLLDSAEFWFNEVINSKNNIYAPKSYYSLIEINRQKGLQDKVNFYYDVLLSDYPNSEYTFAAKKLKGGSVDEINKSKLEPIYEKALAALENKKTLEAIKLLKEICPVDTNSEFCVKSLYTIGWVFENILNNNDSAKYYYKILIDKYSQSLYASAVTGKVIVSDDTSKLSQFIKIKEIIPPPPPAPKYTQTEQGRTKQSGIIQQRGDLRSRDIRDEEIEEDVPDVDIDDEEPTD